jgi:hypothetical protein
MLEAERWAPILPHGGKLAGEHLLDVKTPEQTLSAQLVYGSRPRKNPTWGQDWIYDSYDATESRRNGFSALQTDVIVGSTSQSIEQQTKRESAVLRLAAGDPR